MSIITDLEYAIQSRYTLIYINTQEEDRLIEEMDKLCKANRWQLLKWNYAIETKDPITFLKGKTDNMNGIILLQDGHVFLNDTGNLGHVFRRFLRNKPEEWKARQLSIVITSPILKIHEDLKKDFLVMNDSLPEYDEVSKIITDFLDRNELSRSLPELLIERICLACMGLTQRQILRVLAKSIYKFKRIDESSIDLIIEEKKNIIQQSGVLEFYHSKETLEVVGGLDLLKNWLKQRRAAFSISAQEYGLPLPKGLLILGVQGTGKSLTAKAVSSLWHLPLLRLDIGKVFGSLVGESESKIREALQYAEAISPCILWIDEIDKAFSGLDGPQGDSGTSARVFGTFLTWLQEKQKPVFVVATANNISKLPPEMLRKGRFDEIFFVDLPNENELKDIVKIHINKTERDPRDYNLQLLVDSLRGFTGAEIEQTIIDAMYAAFERDEEYTTEDIIEAAKQVVPLSKFMSDQIDALRAWAQTNARRASSRNIKPNGSEPSVII